MPTIELNVSTRVDRHLAAVRLMSCMTFPDDPDLRKAAEVTFREKLAEWYAMAFAQRPEEKQKALLFRIRPKMQDELPRALADPSKWAKNWILNNFLEPYGGIVEGAAVLADSPSARWLEEERRRRWFAITYTGKLVVLLAAMYQHHESVGPSLKKAVFLLRKMDGDDKRVTAGLKRLGFPAVYESSLRDAWRRFKPVAHLCAAYVITDCVFYQAELARDFMEYWQRAPAIYDDSAFVNFCHIARAAELILTTFCPHGQSEPLVPKSMMYSMPCEIFNPSHPLFTFPQLTSEQLAMLEDYRAAKVVV